MAAAGGDKFGSDYPGLTLVSCLPTRHSIHLVGIKQMKATFALFLRGTQEQGLITEAKWGALGCVRGFAGLHPGKLNEALRLSMACVTRGISSSARRGRS